MNEDDFDIETQPDRVLVKYAPSLDAEYRGILDMRLQEPGALFLAHVEVKPEWRGQGIGSAMFDSALAEFQKRGPVRSVEAQLATMEADGLWESAQRRHGRDIRFYGD